MKDYGMDSYFQHLLRSRTEQTSKDKEKDKALIFSLSKLLIPTLDFELPIPISISFCSLLLLHLEKLMIRMMK